MTPDGSLEDVVRGEVLRNAPMGRHTSFRIGGPADVVIRPEDEEDVVAAIRWAGSMGLPVTVLGNGTNVLVSDRGIRGVVLLVGRTLGAIEVAGDEVRAGCGAPLMKVAVHAARAGLSGLEFAEGIPGTLGGAIVMNAGTSLGEVKDCLVDVTAVTPGGEAVTLAAGDMGLGYRTSLLRETRCVLLSARFRLRQASPAEVGTAMERLRAQRHATQPHWERSAGCVFKNPGDGRSAGRLLDEAGAKGMTVGGAMVSPQHANFVVNTGGATANDVAALMDAMRHLVRNRFGVTLMPEVEFLGEWDTPPLADLD